MTVRENQRMLCKLANSPDERVSSKAIRELLQICNNTISSLSYAMAKIENVEIQDLRSAGKLGVMNALAHYKPEFRNTFKTYATFWIFGTMIEHIWDSRPVFIPTSERNIKKTLISELGKIDPSCADDVRSFLSVRCVEYEDNISDDDEQSDGVSKQTVEDLLSHLSPRSAAVMRKIYGLDHGVPMHLSAIESQTGIKPPRICQIRKESLKIMRKAMEAENGKKA